MVVVACPAVSPSNAASGSATRTSTTDAPLLVPFVFSFCCCCCGGGGGGDGSGGDVVACPSASRSSAASVCET